ncbi:HupE/UreJ family protein [Paenibacillus sp. YYML68]|uniref:HupE/UreJ family protein n=1 Tax=Paenibacillus sp. YYML68 TaxID=2909250 RepID=UPI00248FD8A6|nr:HupE/UreJ family protein [Paenibacillus sp. YYML68]
MHLIEAAGRSVIGLFVWRVLLVGCLLLGLSFPSEVEAHFSSSGFSDIVVEKQGLSYQLVLAEHDLMEGLKLDADQDGVLSKEELAQAQSSQALDKFVSNYLIVTGDGKVGVAKLGQAEHITRSKMPMVNIPITYSFDKPATRYQVQYAVFYDGLDPQHRSFASIRFGDQIIEQVLNKNNSIVQFKAAQVADSNPHTIADPATTGGQPTLNDSVYQSTASGTLLGTVGSYMVMGMEHIFSGIDHLLFVAALVLTHRSMRRLLLLLTAFTVGHSLTLILASLELASMSPLIVEPLIALSIVYVAARSIWRKDEEERWGVALLFGLIHGFGFAELLQGTLSGSVALPLLAFNVGVELGQVAVVLLVLPLLWAARRWIPRTGWVQVASGIVGVLGLYWFIERILQV